MPQPFPLVRQRRHGQFARELAVEKSQDSREWPRSSTARPRNEAPDKMNTKTKKQQRQTNELTMSRSSSSSRISEQTLMTPMRRHQRRWRIDVEVEERPNRRQSCRRVSASEDDGLPNGQRLTRIALDEQNVVERPQEVCLARARVVCSQLLCVILLLVSQMSARLASAQQAGLAFPGVTRDLASFCSARPSLSIDLAPMLIHVKRNTSFNYKLYLFSNDEHVFQTGQIVPRDDFRVHSFPVKLKPLSEFVPLRSGDTPVADGSQQGEQSVAQSVEVYQLSKGANQSRPKFVRVPSSSFDSKQFFAQVPLLDEARKRIRSERLLSTTRRPVRAMPFDVQGDGLPGDDEPAHHSRHDVASLPDAAESRTKPHFKLPTLPPSNGNEHIEFDRDDQLAVLSQTGNKFRDLNRGHSITSEEVNRKPAPRQQYRTEHSKSPHNHQQTMVMPVGSFSSFRVNFTYLVRKDFGQVEPELVRFRVDPHRFQVDRIDLIEPRHQAATVSHQSTVTDQLPEAAGSMVVEPEPADYAFLSHKMLRDPNTRITSISQIYEDWITRNFYTIVYIQRRPDNEELDNDNVEVTRAADEIDDATGPQHGLNSKGEKHELMTDRLVFRGSSVVLLGADQLEYHVKASAFITEKNGLHYYLEFLPNGKFYLGAIDWTKRPFKFIDAQRFPIKPTQTQFDNEELLLCPPSVCYAEQPVDELIAYGRLPLSDKLQREAGILSKSSSSLSSLHASNVPPQTLTLPSSRQRAEDQPQTPTTVSHQSESISLDNLIEAMKSNSSRLDLRLHLRDWVWQVSRVYGAASDGAKQKPTTATHTGAPSDGSSRFAWQYERARRNDIKVAPDTYGFALVGHEIDASYRVFNELYLISANQLISINYTLVNETVTSVQPLEEEFAGLSSSLLDPITGAFYDRYSNQIYFFKGDRYVGYDYATKKPLEDFLLPPAVDESLGGLGLALMMRPRLLESTATTLADSRQKGDAKQLQGPLVSSLPVVGILGRQHHVDAIYHDLLEDVVYVFSGMKFYTHQASDFKDGAFKPASNERQQLPPMRCINVHFLEGCRFDAAYPNPCKGDQVEIIGGDVSSPFGLNTSGAHAGHNAKLLESPELSSSGVKEVQNGGERESSFNDEQQMKLRSIAARGGGAGNNRLMDFLLENTLVSQGAARAIEPFLGASDSKRTNEHEQIVIYLLIAMVLVTVLVTVAMILIVLNWTRSRSDESRGDKLPSSGKSSTNDQKAMTLGERPIYPAAISNYLTNQYQQQQQQQGRLGSDSFIYGGQQFPRGGQPPPPPSAESLRQYRMRADRQDQRGPVVNNSVF